MTIDDFRRIDAKFRAEKSNLFRLATPDAVASGEDVARVEQQLGVKLSPSYREFLLAFGGGSFGLTTIFSADPNGEWYIPRKHAETSEFLPSGLLAFSDDFAGGYYVLKVNDRAAEEPVYYWNQDGGLVQTEFDNMLAFVARYGYEPA
jgi:hypothetical protein